MMGWNDITGDKLHGYQSEVTIGSRNQLQRDAVVQFWTGNHDLMKAAKRGYKIVNSYFKYTYLNFNHDRITPGLEYDFEPIPLEKHMFNPIPEGLTMQEQKQIIGIGVRCGRMDTTKWRICI